MGRSRILARVDADCGSGTKNPAPVNPAIRVRMARSASDTAAITSAGWPRSAFCSSSSTSPQRGQPSAGK